MVLTPLAHTAASSMAMPARMSGDGIGAPRSRLGPATIARCGSHSTMRAPIAISLSTKNIRDSNIFSNIRITPSHWVAVTIAIDIRSAGKAGHGWSSSFGTWPPKSSLDFQGLTGRHDQVVALDLADNAEPLKTHPDRAQMLDAGARDAQRRARHRGEPDQRADLDMIGPIE